MTTYNPLVLLLHSNLTTKSTFICRFNAIYCLFYTETYFLGHPVCFTLWRCNVVNLRMLANCVE